MRKYIKLKRFLLLAILIFTLVGISGQFNGSIMVQTAWVNAQQLTNSSEPYYSGQLSKEVLSSPDYIQHLLAAPTDPNLRWQVGKLTTTASGAVKNAAYIRNEEGDLFYLLKVDSESLLLTFATRRKILLIREVVFKVDNKTVFDATEQYPIPLVQQKLEGDGMNGFHICILNGKRNPRNDPFINRLVYGSTLAIEFYGEHDKLERVQFNLKKSMASIRQVLK